MTSTLRTETDSTTSATYWTFQRRLFHYNFPCIKPCDRQMDGLMGLIGPATRMIIFILMGLLVCISYLQLFILSIIFNNDHITYESIVYSHLSQTYMCICNVNTGGRPLRGDARAMHMLGPKVPIVCDSLPPDYRRAARLLPSGHHFVVEGRVRSESARPAPALHSGESLWAARLQTHSQSSLSCPILRTCTILAHCSRLRSLASPHARHLQLHRKQ